MTAITGARVEHPIGASGRFHLRLPAGDVAIRGVDGEIATVVDREGRPLEERFRVERSDGSLALSIRETSLLGAVFGGRDRGAAELSVEVPRGATVTVETASADVRAVDLATGGAFRTASGEVSLGGVGGSVSVVTVSGEVDLDGIGRLDLRVQTVSGDVDVRAPAFGRLEVATTSGDVSIDARLDGSGPFAIQTVSGDAEIVARSGLTIEAKTITGELSSDLPHRSDSGPGRRSLSVLGGATRLTFQSVSGDLEVTEPRDALPTVETPATPTTGSGSAGPASAAGASQAPAEPVEGGAASAIGEPGDPSAPGGTVEERRMALLRALERGEITVDDAMAQLAALEEA